MTLRRTLARFSLPTLAALAALAALLSAPGVSAQTPSVSARIPRSQINSALDQSYRVELRNRAATALTVRIASIALRVADTTALHPLEIRAVHSRANGTARSVTIPAGAALYVTIDTVHRDPINLPRGESHVVLTLDTPEGPVRAEGIVEPIERCLRCRSVPGNAQ